MSSQVQPAPEAPPPYKGLLYVIIVIGNIGFSILASATGALGIGASNSVNDTTVVVVGLYMILFSGILVVYEIAQARPGCWLDNILKKNVGFLYGPIGRSIYIIFIGFLSFGISDPQSLAIATGILVGLWGVAQAFIAYTRPNYFDKKEKYVPQF